MKTFFTKKHHEALMGRLNPVKLIEQATPTKIAHYCMLQFE